MCSQAEVEVSAGSFGRLWGGTTPLPFPTSRSRLHFSAHDSFLRVQSPQPSISQSLSYSDPPRPSPEDPVMTRGLLDKPEPLPPSKILSHICKGPFAE